MHDQSTVNHSNIRRIYEFVKRLYYWSKVKNFIDKYVRNCHTCKRSKASKNRYAELLNFLSISDKSWTDITMNFVIELFVNHEFNVILMIINRFTKMHHYISCTIIDENITTEETTRLLIGHVWKLHELSNIIVSDRESQFVSLLWKIVCRILQISAKLSIAFHFETNEQSEIVNQKMKRYLRNYCNYQQDDWSKWLSMIEFASNVITFAFTELFVFLANYEFESRMSFNSIDIKNTIKERILIKKAFNITKKMKNIWKFIKEKLTNAQKSQKRHVDKSRNLSSKYKVEDMIWLFIKNVKIERSSRKSDHKMIESYKIKKILRDVCQLDLSSSMKIHDTFHTFLLKQTSTNSLIDQIQLSLSLIVMNDEKKYEINDILNSRYHYDKLQYKIVWINHLSDKAWYSTENFEHFRNILKKYHQRYFKKFESKLRLIVIIEAMLSQWIKNEHKEAKQLIQNVLNKIKTEIKENERIRSKKSTLINTFDRH
jgi:hypothetical protein